MVIKCKDSDMLIVLVLGSFILPEDMMIMKINIDNNVLIGGSNIQIMDKNKQICLNTMDSVESGYYTDKPLYHLIKIEILCK